MNAETYLALASPADLTAAEPDDLPGRLTETLAGAGSQPTG